MTVVDYAGGVGASALVMLVGDWPAFDMLFVGAGIGRFAAARATEIPAPAAHPVPPGAPEA